MNTRHKKSTRITETKIFERLCQLDNAIETAGAKFDSLRIRLNPLLKDIREPICKWKKISASCRLEKQIIQETNKIHRLISSIDSIINRLDI